MSGWCALFESNSELGMRLRVTSGRYVNGIVLVLLPGLDGTGQLMRGFVDALGPETDVQLVTYPPDRVLGYSELLELVRDLLPRERRYVLVAESFSGPVACALAASRPAGLLGLVLCASFASSPFPALRRLAFLARYAPVRAIPLAVLAALLLGRWSTPSQVEALRGALASVSPAVLRGRAAAALALDGDQSGIDVPVLYLRAACDRLIPRSASRRVQQTISPVSVKVIEGPHFLLQAVPEACAEAIRAFVCSLATSTQVHQAAASNTS